MNSDNFEEKLRSQPLRKLLPEWRGEVLGAAIRLNRASVTRVHKHHSRWFGWLHDALWPSPVAWGALASLWLFALLPGIADPEEGNSRAASQLSALERQIVREQRDFMVRELGAVTLPAAWRPDRANEPAIPKDTNLHLQRWSLHPPQRELA